MADSKPITPGNRLGCRKYPIVDGQKRCPSCATYKPVINFGIDNSHPDGYYLYCKPCAHAKNAVSRAKPAAREKQRAREILRSKDPIKRARKYATRKIRDAKPGAKEKNASWRLNRHRSSPRYAFLAILGNKRRRGEMPKDSALTIDQVMRKWEQQEGYCAISGLKMTWAPGHCGPTPTSISIDQIAHDSGYTDANTRLVCHWANSFRGRMSDTEMLLAAKAVVANLERKENAETGPKASGSQSENIAFSLGARKGAEPIGRTASGKR